MLFRSALSTQDLKYAYGRDEPQSARFTGEERYAVGEALEQGIFIFMEFTFTLVNSRCVVCSVSIAITYNTPPLLL